VSHAQMYNISMSASYCQSYVYILPCTHKILILRLNGCTSQIEVVLNDLHHPICYFAMSEFLALHFAQIADTCKCI
jgi:hypothetical protein